MAKAINITDDTYPTEMAAIEAEALIDNRRSHTEQAAVLIREAVAARQKQRTEREAATDGQV